MGRYDLIATLSFNSLRDFNDLVSRLCALASVSYCEQWLHVQLVRERYERTLDQLKATRAGVGSKYRTRIAGLQCRGP